ncbi:M56 family metallopeptidase [Brevibacterium jeotgali]|uniref:Zn-dependent protease with chaperone function n=1 Tax=Brevibacterium jeotgali TaxID=1262550 RepID=A0A2H1L886_9MICO|nr:M56 family metallopeptidase [Brevibacterium jeotgali]TWC02673.1 Zn-dependent protease with chaperone function [Brevibacterium jeotgali]SMY12583.1 Zn-dependent protease with chaperone function [Brevibacterium jeotgali]
MTVVGFALAAFAVVLAWPIPEAVAAAQNRSRRTADPVAAVIIWQAIGVAGGFSLISACIAFALAPLVHVPGIALDDALDWWRWPLLAVGIGLLALLLGSLLWEARSARLHRARHREVLSLVSEPREGAPETRVIETDHALAYSVAGGSGTTVVSTGLLALLEDEERDAVLAHEREHLRLRHDLLTLAFASWHRMLPFLPATRTALEAVSAAIEIMADDAARRSVSDRAFVRALTKVSAKQAAGSKDYDPDLTDVRIARLSAPVAADMIRSRVRAAVYAVCLVAVPPLILVGTIIYS